MFRRLRGLGFSPQLLIAFLSFGLFIYPGISEASVGLSAQNQPSSITGIVTDANNLPVPGVSVLVKGTSNGTSTDTDGSYTLHDVPENGILVFSLIGYNEQEIPVTNQKQTINVTLIEETTGLDEVVVIGYGTQAKKDVTGAISQVKAADLADQHPNSVSDILRGNVPGVNVAFSASPKGGNNDDLQVRGRASLTAGRTPLLVVDGVIYPGQLSDINPSDIETIDILKDASSAAVYGAKAASGVVLITTKRGISDKPTITLNTTVGVATKEVTEHVYDATGFVDWRTDVLKSMNSDFNTYEFDDPRSLPADISMDDWFAYDGSPTTSDPVEVWLRRLKMFPVEIENYKTGGGTDWEDLVYQNGLRQDHTLAISGRKPDLNYYLSMGYTDNNGLTVGDHYNNMRGRVNLEAKAADFVSIGMNLQYAIRDESSIPVNFGAVRNASPLGEMHNDDGTLRESPNDDPGNNPNPFRDYTFRERFQKYNTLFSSLYLKGNLPFGFSYQVNFTPTYDQGRHYNFYPIEHPNYTARGGYASRIEITKHGWQLDNVLNWKKTFNDIHSFDVTLLANAEKLQRSESEMRNEGFDPNDNLGWHNMGGGIKPIQLTDDTKTTGDALMARLNYSLMQRYMITATVRRDGYSAFGQRNPRATFPSVAFAWTFSEEKFNKPDWFNYGKLRLSYGSVGNRDIDGYLALSDLNTSKYLYVDETGEAYPISILYVNRMSNPDLRWERTSSMNIGLDFSIFNDRLSGSIDVYDKRTSDLLLLRALPDVTGFFNVASNLGGVTNKGLEIALSSLNMERENFSWRSSATFSLNRNKITHLFGAVNQLDDEGNVIGTIENDDPGNGWFIGQDINVIWDLKVLGVWQENEAEEAAKYGVKPGDFRLEDVDGDYKFTDADRQFLGSRSPQFTASLRNEFTFLKNFDFSFSMYSYWGAMTDYNEAKHNSGFPDRQNSYIIPYWTPNNPINDHARLFSSNGGASFSVYRKTSFIRLDNVSLAYTVPSPIVQKAGISNLRLFATMQNAAVFSPDWIYWDPQNKNPTPRYTTFGLNITL